MLNILTPQLEVLSSHCYLMFYTTSFGLLSIGLTYHAYVAMYICCTLLSSLVTAIPHLNAKQIVQGYRHCSWYLWWLFKKPFLYMRQQKQLTHFQICHPQAYFFFPPLFVFFAPLFGRFLRFWLADWLLGCLGSEIFHHYRFLLLVKLGQFALNGN